MILDGKLGVLPQGDRERVQRLFQILDVTKDGRICENDFDHHFPAVKHALHSVWEFLVQQFDFNNDKAIEPHEFVGHFVIYAVYFMPIEASTSSAHNLVDLFVEWENTFLRNFRQRVSEIEALVREAGHSI